MAADTTTLTEKMRAALRISSTSEKITEEINDCIAACKADMKNDGVKVIKETDGLIIRAITLYCKAEFGFNNAAEQFRKSYDALKMRLSLSVEYNTAPQVSETDTEKASVKVTIIETYKDKQAQQTFRPGKEFVVTTERAEVLVAAGVAKITK